MDDTTQPTPGQNQGLCLGPTSKCDPSNSTWNKAGPKKKIEEEETPFTWPR
jgi:hypothetical protein